MTVPSTTATLAYNGTGTTATYPYTFAIVQATDIVAAELVVATGVITPLTYGVDFSLTGIGIASGGNLVLTAGNLPAGTRLVIGTDPAEVQNTLFQQGAPYDPASVMAALDLVTRQIQSLKRQVTNALQFPFVESLAGLTSTLPVASKRASQLLAFDAAGSVTTASSATALPGTGVVQVLDSIAALKSITAPLAAPTIVLRGYYAAGDGGGGEFWWNAADSTADNGGTIIQLNSGGVGRYNRIIETIGGLNVKWFGAKADGDTTAGTGTDNGPFFNNCISAFVPSSTVVQSVFIPPGNYRIGTRVNIPSGIAVRGWGIWSTYLFCASAYVGDVVRLNGAGGPATLISNMSVIAQVGGAPSATGINVVANGSFLDSVWVNGFATGIVIAGTDTFLSNFAAELNTTGIQITASDVNVTHGTVYGNGDGLVVANSAAPLGGPVIVTSVRATSGTNNGFIATNSKNVIFNGCAVAHPNNGKFATSGFTINGTSDGVQLIGCSCQLGTQSTTAAAVLIDDSAANVLVDGGLYRGFQDGIVIKTSGLGIRVIGAECTANLRHGIVATSWTGPDLVVANCTCGYNGTAAGGDCGINIGLTNANQNLVCNSNMVTTSGGSFQDYGIQVNCTQASSKGTCQGNTSANNNTANYNFIGGNIANVLVTGANA